MSTTLPAAPSDPRFDAARKHADTVRKGFRLTVAACVVLGLELLRLKEELGATHGGARLNDFTLPWKELVARETGFTYVRCQDFIKAAKAVRERLLGSRKKGDQEVKLLVQSPPATWTDEDYDAFADHIGSTFNTDTFKSLMGDLFPEPEEKPEKGGLTQGDFYDDMMAAHDCVATPILGLHRTSMNPVEFARHVYELPLDDLERDEETGRPPIFGLRTLRTILTQAGEQIDQAIAAKAKSARGKVS